MCPPPASPGTLYTSANFPRSDVHHLQRTTPILGARLNTLSYLFYYQQLMRELRAAIETQLFAPFVTTFYVVRAGGPQ